MKWVCYLGCLCILCACGSGDTIGVTGSVAGLINVGVSYTFSAHKTGTVQSVPAAKIIASPDRATVVQVADGVQAVVPPLQAGTEPVAVYLPAQKIAVPPAPDPQTSVTVQSVKPALAQPVSASNANLWVTQILK